MSEKYPSSNSTGSFSTTTPKRAVFQEAKTYYVNYVEGLEALAADRLKLLREIKRLLVSFTAEGSNGQELFDILVLIENELAKALVSEQSEEELGDD